MIFERKTLSLKIMWFISFKVFKVSINILLFCYLTALWKLKRKDPHKEGAGTLDPWDSYGSTIAYWLPSTALSFSADSWAFRVPPIRTIF